MIFFLLLLLSVAFPACFARSTKDYDTWVSSSKKKTWAWIRDASSKINLEVVLPDPVQACVEESRHRKLTNFTADSLMDDDEEASDTSVGQLGQSAEDEIKAYRE
jgi:hypothetical protein